MIRHNSLPFIGFADVLHAEQGRFFIFKCKIWMLAGFSMFFFMSGFISGSASAGETNRFHCNLGSDGRALAKAELQLLEDGSAIIYTLEVFHRIEDISMAHLHLGKAGEIASPVVWLYPAGPPPRLIPGPFEGILTQGTITEDRLVGPLRGKPLSLLIAEIRAGNVYVNIHTRTRPRGEICGPVYLSEDD